MDRPRWHDSVKGSASTKCKMELTGNGGMTRRINQEHHRKGKNNQHGDRLVSRLIGSTSKYVLRPLTLNSRQKKRIRELKKFAHQNKRKVNIWKQVGLLIKLKKKKTCCLNGKAKSQFSEIQKKKRLKTKSSCSKLETNCAL